MLALKGEKEKEGSESEGRENFPDIKMDQVYAVLNVFLQIFKVNIACRKGKWSIRGEGEDGVTGVFPAQLETSKCIRVGSL